jgi:hypothetical protein
MVDQATMRTRESRNGFPAARLGRGVADLAHDAITIAQLQARLVAVDLKESSQAIRRSILLAVLGGALLVACLPVGMLGLAQVLVEEVGWKTWIAYLATAAAGVALSGLLFWLCWSAIKKSTGAMRRSTNEMTRNVEWLKEALRGHGEAR